MITTAYLFCPEENFDLSALSEPDDMGIRLLQRLTFAHCAAGNHGRRIFIYCKVLRI
jgi:hypothetical protein